MSNKTQPSNDSVDEFIRQIAPETKRQDSQTLLKLMQQVSSELPVLWGSIIGFGQYHYRYTSGREGDFFRLGFAPRKQQLSVYIIPGFEGVEALLEKLGPHKTAKSCLYIKRLSDIDPKVLEQICQRSWQLMAERYP